MDIRQLRYFLTIAKEGQISRAAKKLHMAQPPLSQQLQIMEEELGVTLIERKKSGKSMELTGAGKVLYKRAESILQQFEKTMVEVKETGEGLRGELCIGTGLSCVSYLPERIRYFRERFPSISFKLWEGDPSYLSERLKKRDIEIAIVRFPVDLSYFDTIRLQVEPYVFVAPQSWDSFPSQKVIEIKEIANVPLLLLHRINGEGVYEWVKDECRRFGFEPNVVCKCPDVSMLLSLVAAGIGCTIIPKSALTSFSITNIKVMDLLDSQLQSESAVIWPKNGYLSKAARRFLELF
jgi:LysR family transcriptional regulator, salicylic acid-responsive activator of bsdBCD